MRRFPKFSDVESERLVDAAVEVIAKRCSEDTGYLQWIIRDRLGIAEAVLAPVYERCQHDHAYLTGVVRDHVLRLSEQAVLDLLQGSMDSNHRIERLGFDPLDPRRAQAYWRATSYPNRHQTIVLVAAFCVSVFMLLFPPWVEERWRTQKGILGGDNRVELLASRFVGYGPWASYNSRTDVPAEGPGLEQLFVHSSQPRHDGQETVYRWEFRLLAIQFLVVWGIAVVVLIALGTRKRTYADWLMQCGASMVPARTAGAVDPATSPDGCGITPSPPAPVQLQRALVGQIQPMRHQGPGEACLSCGKPFPPEAARCPACGWTWGTKEADAAEPGTAD